MSQQVSPATVVVVLVLLLAILVGLYFLVVSTRQAAPGAEGAGVPLPPGAGQPAATFGGGKTPPEPSASPPPASPSAEPSPAAGAAAPASDLSTQPSAPTQGVTGRPRG